jgi:hypothetical protein
MAKKSAALFEAMSRTRGLKPPPAAGVRSTTSPSHTQPPGGSGTVPGTTAPGVLSTPAWMKKVEPQGLTPTSGATPVEHDGDRQEVRLRLSYTAIGIIIFGIITAIALAVVIGKDLSNRHKMATETTNELLAGPAKPQVLNARPGQGGTAAPETDTPEAPGAVPPLAPPPNTGGNNVPPMAPPVRPPTNSGRTSREIGLNYIVVQSYPDEAAAQASVDLLGKNGIPATVEKSLPGFGKYLSVVTANGYPKGSRENEDLRKRIDQISADQGRRDRKWKAWTPLTYKWK